MPDPIMDAGLYLRAPQGRRRKVLDDNGNPKWERLPSSAGRKRHRAVLRDDGHVVNQCLTSHSANLDMESSQAVFYKKKTNRLGWIPTGKCPVVLAMSGQIDPMCLCKEVRDALKAGEGCQPQACSEDAPCKHVIAEKTARRAERLKVEEKRAKAHQTKEDKQLQAQRDTQATIGDAMREMTEVLTKQPATKRKAKSEASE